MTSNEVKREFARQIMCQASRRATEGVSDAETLAVWSLVLQWRWSLTLDETLIYLGPYYGMDDWYISELTGCEEGRVREMTYGHGSVRGKISLLSRLDPGTAGVLDRYQLPFAWYEGYCHSEAPAPSEPIPRQGLQAEDCHSEAPAPSELLEWRARISDEERLIRAAVCFLALEARAGLEPEEALLYIRPELEVSWESMASALSGSMGRGINPRSILDRAERKVAVASSAADVFLGCPPAFERRSCGSAEPMPEAPEGDSAALSEIVKKTALDLGYDEEVSARFVAYRGPMVLPHAGSDGSVELTYSDYFADAPDEVLSALARSWLTMSEGDAKREEGMRIIFRWYSSAEFRGSAREKYLRRNRGLAAPSDGDSKSLESMVASMVGCGLVEAGSDFVLRWSDDCGETPYMSSVIVGIVTVPRDMDDAEVPDSVIEYILYSGFGHLSSFEGRADRSQFPEDRAKEAERWLERHGYHAWDGSTRSDRGAIDRSWAKWLWLRKQRTVRNRTGRRAIDRPQRRECERSFLSISSLIDSASTDAQAAR